MKVKLLKKIRKRFSIREQWTGFKDDRMIYYLYDGKRVINIAMDKYYCINKIRCIICEQYANHSKHYKFN